MPLRLRLFGETVAFLRKCFILCWRMHRGETQLALLPFQCMTIMRPEPSLGTSPLFKTSDWVGTILASLATVLSIAFQPSLAKRMAQTWTQTWAQQTWTKSWRGGDRRDFTPSIVSGRVEPGAYWMRDPR